jgi:trimethylamine--corrinoid protein Co-methyltransferase
MRPTLELLSKPLVERIVSEAMDVLFRVGIFVEHREALTLLGDHGARIDGAAQRAFIPEELVQRCLSSTPRAVQIYDRGGEPALRLEGFEVYFDPGSSALRILDVPGGTARPPVTRDLVRFARLTDAMPNLAAQSTALVPCDVPESMADRYRLFVALMNSTKPVITGTFTVEGFEMMRQMLVAVSGSEDGPRKRPMAIFDACASQPLKWSALTTQTLLDCARTGLPAELISVPLLGATAPLTLAGGLVQHAAENLSGLVIHQLAGKGSPVIYGGSAAVFDMRHGTIALGAIESMMLAAAYAQIGRHLGLPTHGYVGLSDAKVLDVQAGLESGIGAVIAALAGINMVSGAGMLEFENCQSLEKLVIDDEICGMARRLVAGIEARQPVLAEDLFSGLSEGDHFLTSATTMQWLRSELVFPGRVIDRQTRELWEAAGRKDAVWNAHRRVTELLSIHQPKPLAEEARRTLSAIMLEDAQRHGVMQLPSED